MLPQAPDQLGGEPPDSTERPWLRHYDPQVPHTLDYPRVPLYQVLDAIAARCPDRFCTSFFGSHLSYLKVKTLSDRLAAGLRRLGVHRGDRVALLLPNSPQFVVAFFAVLKAGAVVVPGDPLAGEHELSTLLRESGVAAALTIPALMGKILRARDSRPELDGLLVLYSRLSDFLPLPYSVMETVRETKLIRQSRGGDLADMNGLMAQPLTESLRPEPVRPDVAALLLLRKDRPETALSHYACVANACQVAAWGHLTGEGATRALIAAPLSDGLAIGLAMSAPLAAASEIVLVPRLGPADLLDAIRKQRPEVVIGSASAFAALSASSGADRCDLRGIEGLVVGGQPLADAHRERLEARTGIRVSAVCGLGEAVTAFMGDPCRGRRKTGSIGIPLPDVDAKVVDVDDGRDLPPGETGEIVLRGPSLVQGRHRRTGMTAPALSGGWHYSGDIGYMDEDGYFFVTEASGRNEV